MKKLLLLITVLAFISFNANAQTSSNVTNISADLNYAEINNRLATITKSLLKSTPKPEDVKADAQYIGDIRNQLLSTKKDLEHNLKYIEKKIDALGEKPEDGSKEVPLIAQKRKEFNAELSTQKARIAEADILLTRLDEVDLQIINYRNSELLDDIMIRTEPLIYPSVLLKGTGSFVTFIWDIIKSPLNWYDSLNADEQNTLKSKGIPVLFLVLLVSLFGWYLRTLIMRYFGYSPEIDFPRYGKKVSAAVAVAIAYGVIPAFIIGTFLVLLYSLGVFNSDFFGKTLLSFLYYSLFVILGRAISRVIFAPYNERWRLVNVENEKALRVTHALYFSVLVIGISSFLTHVATFGNYTNGLVPLLTAVSSGIKAFCIILVVKRLLWDKPSSTTDEEEEDNDDDASEEAEGEDNKDDKLVRFTIILSLFLIVSFGISLFGYPYLSAFILNRFITSVILIGILIALRKVFYDAIHRLLLLRLWVKTFRLRRRLIRKLDFWSGIIIDPLFVLIGGFVILSLWGVPTDMLSNLIVRLFTGFKIGGVEISLIAIILGIIAYFLVIALFRGIRRRLQDNVFSKMDMDDGIKHSLIAGISFVGYVIAILVAVLIMGADLSNLALVAGALSVGIGLGLQNIVNNFVSGIILLFERPIKVGDWVLINGEEGKVKQINIRSTEVETFKKSSLIIPNATLLSSSITNLTHSNNAARMSLMVGVAYGTDPRKVEQILLECAAKHRRVLKNPAPCVIFKDFGDNSMNFELRCHTNDIWNGWSIPSDLRYEIVKRFDEEGIVIPFPQRVLHFGDMDNTPLKVVIDKQKDESDVD